MKEFIYRWNGEYFGFIYNNRFFDKYSKYLGWLDNEEVWRKDGTFLGELIDSHYILRRTRTVTRAIRAVRTTPATPASPALRTNRAARSGRNGFIDSLEEYQ